VGFHTARRIQIQSARSAAKRATSKFYWWRLREKQRIVSNVVPALRAIRIEPIRGDGFMSMFGTKEKSSKYHAETTGEWPAKGSEAVTRASDEQLQKWASDPDCIEQEQSAAHLKWRLAERAKRKEEMAAKRQELQDNPFDPRTEVSADAKHIARRVVTHLWILFVALPLVLALLFQILK